MIAISDDQLLKLAQGALQAGALEQCRKYLLMLQTAKQLRAMLANITYELAKEKTAQGKYQEARELFADTLGNHPARVVRCLAQERNTLINRILKERMREVYGYRELLTHMRVQPALRVDSRMLGPEIRYTGSPAAYRSGWDSKRADPLSTLIRRMKAGVDEAIIQRLGEFLAVYVCFQTRILISTDFIIPVPTRPERVTQRGYSIPRILGEQISKLCAIPLHDELVRTVDGAPELRSVPRWYRTHAVSGAFTVARKAEWLKDRAVLVIDDVITTGSTVREVARTLLQHDAREISAIALAHTERSG